MAAGRAGGQAWRAGLGPARPKEGARGVCAPSVPIFFFAKRPEAKRSVQTNLMLMGMGGTPSQGSSDAKGKRRDSDSSRP